MSSTNPRPTAAPRPAAPSARPSRAAVAPRRPSRKPLTDSSAATRSEAEARMLELLGPAAANLSREQMAAALKAARSTRSNPLRRVFLACHGWLREPTAGLNEWVWCEPCSDWARVKEVAE